MNTNQLTKCTRSRQSSSSDYAELPQSDKRHEMYSKQNCSKRKRVSTWSFSPIKGYIMHPTAGLLMHPSFYTHTPKEVHSGVMYEPEVDDPLCAPSAQCHHERDCFEMRVAMAVMAHRRGASYRDAEVIWGVSRSTIQRRRVKMRGRSAIHFLVTPMRKGKSPE